MQAIWSSALLCIQSCFVKLQMPKYEMDNRGTLNGASSWKTANIPRDVIYSSLLVFAKVGAI